MGPAKGNPMTISPHDTNRTPSPHPPPCQPAPRAGMASCGHPAPRAGAESPCLCGDTETDLLQALVAAGLGQRTVSHLLWGDRVRGAQLLLTELTWLTRLTQRTETT